MNILGLVVSGIVAAILSIIIKQYKPEFSIYISLLAGILILSAVLTGVKPILADINSLTQVTGMSGIYGEVLVKSLAICYLTQLATDTCRDAGETAIASKLETAGKIAIIIIALPVFKSLVEIITSLLS